MSKLYSIMAETLAISWDMASLACKQEVGRGQVPVNDVIIRFSVYITS